jgi:hypothetical protein
MYLVLFWLATYKFKVCGRTSQYVRRGTRTTEKNPISETHHASRAKYELFRPRY